MSLTPDNAPLQGLGSTSPTNPTGVGQGSSAASSPQNGAAFRALLERLEEQASSLEAQSRSVQDASGLAGAVDTARASLEDAVSLSEDLLEAYREALQQRDVAQTASPETPPGTTETTT